MVRLAAFLRGINVGGHTAKKETLLTAFEQLGLSEISTFKQSGNVVFEDSAGNVEELKARIEVKLRATLGFDVPVILRTIEQLKSICDSDQFKGQSPEGSSFLVTMLPKQKSFPLRLPAMIPKSTAQIIAASATEVYSVTHGGGEGALPNQFVESKLKVKATTRNLNTLKEIVEKNDK